MSSCLYGLLEMCYDLVERIANDKFDDVPTKFFYSDFLEIVLMLLPLCPDGHKILLERTLSCVDNKYVDFIFFVLQASE